MKNFERKDKNERRRVRLSKNDVKLINSNSGDATGAAATSAVLAKVQGINRRLLAVVLAITMVLCLVLPALLLNANHVKAANADQIKKREVGELVTKKTVSPTADPNIFDVQLEAYMTSKAIDFKPTDIILVLDISGSMNDELSKRNYINLNNHTVLSNKIPFVDTSGWIDTYNVVYHTLYDPGNNANKEDLSLIGQLTSTYRNRKYLEDPNTPGIYVYVAEAYLGIYNLAQHYQFDFTDSMGNVYSTGDITGVFAQGFRELTFNLVRRGPNVSPSEDIKTTVTVDGFYTRDASDTSSINTEIAQYASGLGDFVEQGVYTSHGIIRDNLTNYTSTITETVSRADYASTKLFIYSDSGEKLPVKISVEQTRRTETYVRNNQTRTEYDRTFISNYIYEAEDPVTGKVYRAVQGNSVYGADYGIFQGFKTYYYEGTGSDRHLVVDHSDSIESKSLYAYVDNQTSVSRLQTMKEAAEDFIIAVHSNAYYRDIDQRIGVVVYSGDASVASPLVDVRNEINTNSIIDSIYALEANGATRIDRGMNTAKSMLGSRTGEDRNRNSVVIAFTDGVPSSTSSYDTGIADSAITHSRDMVRDYGTTVYSVGLFELADSNQMYGPMFYHSGLLSRNEICDGSVGSKWGRTWLAQFVNSDMSDIDAAATNRFLNLLSSNYETANSVGLYKYNWFWDVLTIRGGEGYRIENNYDKTGSGYYFGANNSDALYDAFQQIAEEIAVPESTLGPETVLSDVIAESFVLKGTPEAYTMSYIGTENTESAWNNENNWTSDQNRLNFTVNGDTVSIGGDADNGIDYSSNYVNSQELNDAGNHGKKTVLKFQIETIENFVGGNQVPTNGDESGVYDSEGVLVEDFVVPYKDIPLDYSMEASDQEIYYSQEADLTQLFTVPSFVDGKTNAYSNITYKVFDSDNNVVLEYFIPAGEKGANGIYDKTDDEILNYFPNDLKDNTTYTVQCIVEPIYEGTVDPDDTLTDDGTIYVYKPVFTEKDDTVSNAQAAAGVDLTPTIIWRATGKQDKPLDAPGAPNITYGINNVDTDPDSAATPINDYVMNGTTNFQVVDVTIVAPQSPFVTPIETDVVYYVRDSDGALIKASTYNGNFSELRRAKDADGNDISYEEDGQTKYVYETVSRHESVSRPRTNVRDDDQTLGGFTTYINSTNAEKTDRNLGEFTISVKNYFDIVIDKEFTGDFANAQAITITVTPLGDNDAPETANAQSVVFAAGAFSRSGNKFVSNGAQSITHLDSNKRYLITETFAVDDGDANEPEKAKYNVLFEASSNNQPITDKDNDETNKQFLLEKGNDENEVTVTVTNQAIDIIPTGFGDSDSSPIGFFIRMVLVITAAAGIIYLVFLKRKLRIQ